CRAAGASKVVVSNSAAARSRKLLAWTFMALPFLILSAARIGLAADPRHRLPGAEFEHREPRGVEHGAGADHHVGRRDATVAAERPRRGTRLRLGGEQPDYAGEDLAERIVGDVVEAVFLDGVGATRGDFARQC